MSNKPNMKKNRRHLTTARLGGKDTRPGADQVHPDHPGPGAINAYACPVCSKLTIVIHKDKGVTPMFLACRITPGCDGRAESIGYPPPPAPPKVVAAVRWVWYRPSKKEFNKLEPAAKDHVSRGGLLLRRLTEED